MLRLYGTYLCDCLLLSLFFFLVSFIHSYYLVGCAMIVNGQKAYKEIDCYMMNSSFSELASINDCVYLHTYRILVILKHLKQSYTLISFILYVRTLCWTRSQFWANLKALIAKTAVNSNNIHSLSHTFTWQWIQLKRYRTSIYANFIPPVELFIAQSSGYF